MGIEELQGFDKDVLSEANLNVEEERKEIQIKRAKEILKEILERKDVVEFNLNREQENLKEINKELKVFEKK